MNNKSFKLIIATCLWAQAAATLTAQDLEKSSQKPARQVALQAETVSLYNQKKKVAVMNFTTVGDTSDLGEGAAEILRTYLIETNNYTVVERKALDQVLNEQSLSLTGALDQSATISVGKLLAAKLIVVGSVVKIGETYTLNVRFIDVETGEAVAGRNITTQSREEIPGLCKSREAFARGEIEKETAVAAAEAADVTYAQVLERPDDAELNLAYAKAQVRRGDLKGAAATLERMLMVKEDLHSVRLFYAVVLFRLDNLAEAGRELEAVKKSRASAAVKREADGYAQAIRKRQRVTFVSGGLSAGVQYDSNRNAAPTSAQRLFMDSPLTLTGLSRRRDDASFLFVGSADLRRALGRQKEHEATAGFSYYRADQDRVKTVNLQAASLKAGGAYKRGAYTFRPLLNYDKVKLRGEDFLINSGAGVRAERRLDKLTEASAEARYAYQDHLRSENISSNPQRRGPLFSLSAGAARVLSPVMKLAADLTYTDKRADKRYNAYAGGSLALRHSWLLGKGRFLLSSLILGNEVYRQADAMISRRTRKDASVRAGLTAGVPLAGLHPKLARLTDVTLSVSLEHFNSRSTLTNYSYENNKASVLLNYRWDLGL